MGTKIAYLTFDVRKSNLIFRIWWFITILLPESNIAFPTV